MVPAYIASNTFNTITRKNRIRKNRQHANLTKYMSLLYTHANKLCVGLSPISPMI